MDGADAVHSPDGILERKGQRKLRGDCAARNESARGLLCHQRRPRSCHRAEADQQEERNGDGEGGEEGAAPVSESVFQNELDQGHAQR